MHAPHVLCEKIFAIEVIIGPDSGPGPHIVGMAVAEVATVVAQLKVLGGYMAFPFIL